MDHHLRYAERCYNLQLLLAQLVSTWSQISKSVGLYVCMYVGLCLLDNNTRHAVYVDYLYLYSKLVNLSFSVCFATGYIHSGEIKIFNI